MKKTHEEKQLVVTDTNVEDLMQKQGGTDDTSAGNK